MTSPIKSSGIVFDIVPSKYIESVKNRVNVTEVSEEKIKELMKTADIFEQEVILQDLLIAGKKMETTEEKNMSSLAAELYVKSSQDLQTDFLMYVLKVDSIFKNFSSAMITNSLCHQLSEFIKEGGSGLTIDEIKKEATLAISLGLFMKERTDRS